MAIHRHPIDMQSKRRGVQGLTRSTAFLGRLLLTIDDLDALMEVLGSRGSNYALPTIYFSGGHIDDPSDIRHLTDTEVATIVLVSEDVYIELSRGRSQIQGDAFTVDHVIDGWASVRLLDVGTYVPKYYRTSNYPTKVKNAIYVGRVVVFIAIMVVVLGLLLAYRTGGTAVVIFAGIALFAIWQSSYQYFKYSKSNYAIVLPITFSEYRELRDVHDRHLQLGWISSASPAIALLLGVLGFIVGKS